MATKQADGAAAVPRARTRVEEITEPAAEPMVPEEVEASPLESSKRRMPDKFRRYLLRVQGGKFYLPAAYRIVWFRDECPEWGIRTEIIEGGQEAGFATVRAEVLTPEGYVLATGHKTETAKDFPAGWVEKAETGAVARALSVAGFGTQFSPELDEEMLADSPQPVMVPGAADGAVAGRREWAGQVTDSGRTTAAMRAAASEVWEGPGQCPRCHAPTGKRHGKPCING